jgi:metal-sulfur cluster biosynthetic enzyme
MTCNLEELGASCAIDALYRAAANTGSLNMKVADEDILATLRGINDPELGINIVDLGLVYSAELSADRIDVAITLTAPS